jgi:hypothetical protein
VYRKDVLGPLLFLIYIDLPGSIRPNSLPTLFADDTNIICTHCDPHLFSVEESAMRLIKWFKANLLTLNLKKTKFVQFATKPNQGFVELTLIIITLEILEAQVFWDSF